MSEGGKGVKVMVKKMSVKNIFTYVCVCMCVCTHTYVHTVVNLLAPEFYI